VFTTKYVAIAPTSGRASSVNATPTFFVDGARYANSRNVEALRDAIFDAALRAAQRVIGGP